MYDFQKIVGMSWSFKCNENRKINTYFGRLVRYALHKVIVFIKVVTLDKNDVRNLFIS